MRLISSYSWDDPAIDTVWTAFSFLVCFFCILLSWHSLSVSVTENTSVGNSDNGNVVHSPACGSLCLLSSPFDVDVAHVLASDALLIQDNVLGIPDDHTQVVPENDAQFGSRLPLVLGGVPLQGSTALGLLTSWLSWEWCWKGGLVGLSSWGRHPPTSEVFPKPYT